MPRENSKCRKWEHERRGRINDCFSRLGKLLPCYDPSSKLSKIEILTKASVYIEELEGKVKNFLTESTNDVDGKAKAADGELRQLYGRVKRLLSRNEQLCRLLRDAGITVPKECGGVKLACKSKKWSQKITPEKAEVLRKMEEQKENEPKKAKVRATPKKKFLPKSKAPSKLKFTKKSPGKILKNGNVNTVNAARVLPSNVVAVTNVLTQPYYFITNGVSNNVVTKAGAVNPSVIATPAVQKSVAIVTKPSAFPTGTIILPVIQQPALLNPPIILNPPPTNTLIVVNKTTTTTAAATGEPAKSDAITVTSKTTTTPVALPPIQPKRRSVTMTTHINKVPIPASRYASNYILVSNIPMPTVQPKKILLRKARSKVKRKLPEKTVAECKKGKSEEVAEKEVKATEEPKPPTSDYSINSICKEKEVEKERVAEATKESVPEPEKAEKPKPADVPETLAHSELSNDIFATLQVPTGSQNPESTSPTAAFLNAFPLVSSFTGVKVAEVMEEETSDSRHDTPTLLQIGTMDTSKPAQTLTDSLTPSLLNLDNFSFFSTKDLYTNFDNVVTTTVTPVATTTVTTVAASGKCEEKAPKILYDTTKVVTTAATTVVTASKTAVCYSYAQSYYGNNCAVDAKAKPSCSRYNIPEYNTFNPFTDLPKTTAPCTYSTTKSYNQTAYVNNCSYNYQPDFATNYARNYESYDNTNQYNYYNPIKSTKAKSNDVPRAPVNWMTAPEQPKQPDFVVPQFSKENDFVYTQNAFVSNPSSQTTYFNTTASSEYSTFNNAFQEEHQFSWSPTKLPQLLDPPHNFVSTTLPTLVGDLALNNTQYTDRNKAKGGKERRGQQGYDTTSNFLSVSQLVDHGKAGRVTARRNSGGRSKVTKGGKRSAKHDGKEALLSPKHKMFPDVANEWQRSKSNVPSSYSAEALIGKRAQQQNYSKNLPVPSFLPDNLITYFPPVDIPQDNAFGQQNQNYQNSTFAPPTFPSSMQNNTFIPNPTTTYLPTTNFIPEITDYNPDNIFSHSKPTKPPPPPPPPNKQIFGNAATPKKSKSKKPSSDNAPFVDFSFLSMPAAINSPILPDDFHAHTNFLAPPPPPAPPPNQLYPCKNPLYPKQGAELGGSLLPLPPVTRSNIHNPAVSPSLNAVGTSLTNFNLSTIFPEINKSAVTDMYLDSSKAKDFGTQRSYLPSSSQIPPFTKAPIYGSIAPQSFSNS